MDAVFATAVEKNIVLSGNLDTIWEIDLSGLSLPVARAACRFIICRLQKEAEAGVEWQDLSLITGVGKHHYLAKVTENDDILASVMKDVAKTNLREQPRQTPGTTALREYVRQILRQDFVPPIYSIVPNNTPGIVQVKKELLQSWVDGQE